MTTDILEAIDEGATVVTANRRLARRIRLDYATWQRSRGREVWSTPKVLPWASWLIQLWHQIGQTAGSEHPKLLSPQQDRAVWTSIVERSTRRDPLLRTVEAATSAQEAWSRVCAWRVPVEELRHINTQETRAFGRWLNDYLEQCTRARWIDPARLPDSCAELLPRIRLRPTFPRRLCLAGFYEVTPQQQSLLERLGENGVETSRWMPEGRPGNLIAHVFPNTQEEMTAAAIWARRHLEADEKHRIGVVVPDLARHRQTVGRIFEDILSPDAVLPGRPALSPAYNLSLGLRLLEYPLVHTAMSLLEFVGGTLSYEQVGHLLRSPFLAGGESEADQRAFLDATARRVGSVNWRLSEYQQFVTTQAAKVDGGCRTLRDVVERLEQIRRSAPRRALPSEWSILFRQVLLCARWPGERALDSTEYQTVEQFNTLLGHLASLDGILGPAEFSIALRSLRRIAADTVYQPEAQESRLVVLGALEASGIIFDALWITGLHDRDWPPPPNPNAFLPVSVQRRYGLPHSSPQREREFAAVTLECLMAGASEAVVSWPEREEDETLRPSPLVKEVPRTGFRNRDPEAFYHRRIFAARRWETLDSDPGPGLTATFFSGGSSVLKHQAACPFRAFALLRLGAESLCRPTIGIDPATRGRLVHQALEQLWNKLESQANLRARSAESIEATVVRSIDAAFGHLPHRRDKAWLTLVQIEKSRLRRLILELLQKEAERAAFTVEACEFSQGVQIGPLKLNTRIDRVDRLDGGGRAIVDYKSGQAEVRRWFGARPDDPQLPLYAVANPEDLEGLVLASLRAGEVAFSGIVRAANQFPGISPYQDTHYQREHGDWNRLLVEWRSHLEALAVAFARGEAQVDPKTASSCDFCDLGTLCRIAEKRARVNG